jgi:uncharacterized protein YutE (UPF0331/DUF86 family)
MKYNGIIENKLRLLDRKLSEIKSWEINDSRKFRESSLLQNAVERGLQVAIEIIIDVSERILALEQIGPQESSSLVIKKLEELNILADSAPFMEMVRFRNFIVHRYEYIDSEILFDIIRNKLSLFSEFITAVRKLS